MRARGFRLYTTGRKRLIDLWLNGGAAVMGHTPPNFLRELKNIASRGLYSPLPHFTQDRYIKALSRLLPGHFFRLYAAPPPQLTTFTFWRPFLKEDTTMSFSQNSVSFGKSFRKSKLKHAFSIKSKVAFPKAEVLGKLPIIKVLVLPGIQTWRENENGVPLPFGLCVVAAGCEEHLAKLPPNDILSPVLLAAAGRGVHDIIASPQRTKPQLPRTFKALKNNPHWRREGIYVFKEGGANNEEWSVLFKQFLEAGFLLPPVPEHLLILPGEMSDGEDAKLAAVLRHFV